VEDFAVLTPRGFANLSALEHIDLASNKLAKLPTSAFSGLSKLNFLSLRDNKIKALPRGLVCMDAVCAYVQRPGERGGKRQAGKRGAHTH
jgi:Leucine-rich repeat (LRR) protein